MGHRFDSDRRLHVHLLFSMRNTRISRIEENRTKKQLYVVLGITIAIILLLVTLGIPVFIGVSGFLLNLKGNPTLENADKTAPVAPILSPLNSATNSATLVLEGYGESNTTLKINLNGETVKETVLGNDGTFSFEDLQLDDGQNTVYATATDKAGNESAISNELKINYMKSGPKLEVSEPADGQTFGKNQEELTIKGKTDIGTRIQVNERFVSVADDGTFSYRIKLQEGENTLKIVATDTAGNRTQVEKKVIYQP